MYFLWGYLVGFCAMCVSLFLLISMVLFCTNQRPYFNLKQYYLEVIITHILYSLNILYTLIFINISFYTFTSCFAGIYT